MTSDKNIPMRLILILGITTFTSLGAIPQVAAQTDDHLIQLLNTKICRQCKLTDLDLMHSDLRDADLNGASLRRANLSQANLDGANLRNTDLSFTTLQGASLRGSDLRGSRLYGTDLRNADLSGAQFDPEALEESHWQGAQGISSGIRSHAALHNAGVKAAQDNLWRDAERLFSEAIQRNPTEPLSWVARGLCRGELDLIKKAAKDLAYAGALFEQEGDHLKAKQLSEASQMLVTNDEAVKEQGNGLGSAILGGTLSTIQSLAPIALRALMPFLP